MTTRVDWYHYTGTADADGVVRVGAPGAGSGEVVVSAGGFATEDAGYTTSTATVMPDGATIRTHTYAVIQS